MKNFDEEIKSGLTLVDFYARWCGPCNMLHPILDELADEIKIIKVDVDNNMELAYKYKINSIPHLIIFKDGIKLDEKIGFLSKEELLDWIKKHK